VSKERIQSEGRAPGNRSKIYFSAEKKKFKLFSQDNVKAENNHAPGRQVSHPKGLKKFNRFADNVDVCFE